MESIRNRKSNSIVKTKFVGIEYKKQIVCGDGLRQSARTTIILLRLFMEPNEPKTERRGRDLAFLTAWKDSFHGAEISFPPLSVIYFQSSVGRQLLGISTWYTPGFPRALTDWVNHCEFVISVQYCPIPSKGAKTRRCKSSPRRSASEDLHVFPTVIIPMISPLPKPRGNRLT